MANILFPNHCPDDQIDYINGYPVPPIPHTRPLKAIKSILALLSDIEETKYVYDLFQAVSGKAYRQGFIEFSGSEYGKKILDRPIKIEEILSQKNRLADLPLGTVGKCYHDMVDEKSFSVDGLLVAAKHAGIDVSEPTIFEAYRRYFIHFEVSHDLWHVLTGYDTDPLGEICLLEFYRAQWPDTGLRMLTALGGLSMQFERPRHAGVFKRALKEGYFGGQNAKSILCADLEWMLETPLIEVRTALNITEPSVYRSIPYSAKATLRGGGATVKNQPDPILETGWA